MKLQDSFTLCVLCVLSVLCVKPLISEAEVFTFEDGGAGWSIPPAYSVVKGEGMNGSSAFVYENSDPNLPYVYPRCEVQLQTGVIYRVSGWLRTENLEPGRYKGAQLAIICLDADGKGFRDGIYELGAWYSPGMKGTEDWQKFEFTTREIPPATAKCILIAYCTPQAIGKAYFDDIQVAPYEDPAVGFMFSSAYRNRTDSGKVKFGVALSVPEKYAPEETKGVFSYVGADGVRKEVSVTPAARDRAFLSLDAAQLKQGDSEIRFTLLAPDGKALGTSSLTFHRPAKMPKRRVWIDEHQRTIVDGKPFFPLGMYSSVPMRRAEYVKGPFNTIASYLPLDAVEMDYFNTNGIKVIYSVKDMHPSMPERTPSTITDEATASAYVHGVVDALRSHPALLAWYVNDESTIERFDALRMRQRLLERIDPDHPTWAVLYQYDMMRAMSPTFDILGADIYPVTGSPLSNVTKGARRTSDAMLGLRPMWHVPQSFDWGLFRDDKPGAPPYRMPTIEEMRSMTWQFIAAGANGLIYYGFSTIQVPKRKDGTPFSFDKAFADVCVVAEEVKRYIPVLLSVEDAPSVTGAPESWGLRVWRKDGETWLLAVNAQDVAASAELKLSEDFATVTPAFGPAAEKTGQRTLKVSLAPNEPALYKIR